MTPELELRRSDLLKKAGVSVKHAHAEAALQGKELVFDLGTKKQSLDRQREVVCELERQVAALERSSRRWRDKSAAAAVKPPIFERLIAAE